MTKRVKPKKMLPKSEVMKLKPGAIIELWWNDSPNTRAILLEKPERKRGDVNLSVAHEFGDPQSPYHGQVVRVIHRNVFELLKENPKHVRNATDGV